MKNNVKFIKSTINKLFLIAANHFHSELSFREIISKYPDPDLLYDYMNFYFKSFLSDDLKSHRSFFKQDQRGFGEDAFHPMWHFIINEYKPKECLEIGVYRGQTISLWALIAKLNGLELNTYGITPLSPIGDSVSVYLKNLDYKKDIIGSFNKFSLTQPKLIKTLSTSNTAKNFIRSIKWDLIYIDGSHEESVVKNDYNIAKMSLSKKGILVFDDSSLYLNYHPRATSFAGHPGPSKIVKDFVMHELNHIATIGHCNIFQNR